MTSQEFGNAKQSELLLLQERLARLEREARERGAREAEHDFLLLADKAPLMLWISRTDADRTFFNRAWLEYRGRRLEQEIGRGWTEGIHPEDLPVCLQTYFHHFETGKEFRIKYRLRRHDGQYCWTLEIGVPRHFSAGELAGYMGSAVLLPEEAPVRAMPAGPRPLLSAREIQVLTLIAEGNSTREAAARLGISYKTADSHRTRIMEKLDVHETASLVRYAIRLGLVKP